jgi:hypothetical protein
MALSKTMQLKRRILTFKEKKPSYTAKNFIEDFPEHKDQENRITQVFNLIIGDEKVTEKVESLINE